MIACPVGWSVSLSSFLLSNVYLTNPLNRRVGIHRAWGICLLLWETRAKRAGTLNREAKWNGWSEVEASGNCASVFVLRWYGLVSVGELRQKGNHRIGS